MKKIPFTKMHGLGNDFMVINVHDLLIEAKNLPITQLANRNLGVGFDQLLVITPKQKVEEFFCQIFNADGSEAEQCGNGLRCVARYVQEEGLCESKTLHISTIAGSYKIDIEDYDHITVDMGAPVIKEKLLDWENLKLSIVDFGNPHAIINGAQSFSSEPKLIAEALTRSHHFPEGANVGFMDVLEKNAARLRTFERGAGETFACGSNACAAAVAGIENRWLQSPVTIHFPYGNLVIDWQGEGQSLKMTGPAVRVFKGEVVI